MQMARVIHLEKNIYLFEQLLPAIQKKYSSAQTADVIHLKNIKTTGIAYVKHMEFSLSISCYNVYHKHVYYTLQITLNH